MGSAPTDVSQVHVGCCGAAMFGAAIVRPRLMLDHCRPLSKDLLAICVLTPIHSTSYLPLALRGSAVAGLLDQACLARCSSFVLVLQRTSSLTILQRRHLGHLGSRSLATSLCAQTYNRLKSVVAAQLRQLPAATYSQPPHTRHVMERYRGSYIAHATRIIIGQVYWGR